MNKYKSSSGNVYCTACASNTHASSCGSDNTTNDSNISAGTCAAGYDSSAASDGTNATLTLATAEMTSDSFTLAAIPSAVITAGNNLTDLLDDTFTNMGLYGGTDGKGALATLVVRYIAILVSDGIIF